jgi:hypothetical protein
MRGKHGGSEGGGVDYGMSAIAPHGPVLQLLVQEEVANWWQCYCRCKPAGEGPGGGVEDIMEVVEVVPQPTLQSTICWKRLEYMS